MILKGLIMALAVVALFAGLQTYRLSKANSDLIEADKRAAEHVLEREREAQRIAHLTRQIAAERERAARGAVRRIETGEFTHADDPIDPALLREFERVRERPPTRP